MQPEHYTISELAAAAGVTPRTVRYYVAEGLLPPPETRGRYALYSDDHLQRLRLIARLKEAYLPLEIIRERVARLAPAEVRQALAAQGAHVAPGSAAAYLDQVLPARPGPGNLAERPQGYLMQVGAAPEAGRVQQPARGLLRGFAEAREGEPAPELAGGEAWRRMVLAPGVELHVREPLSAADRERLAQLIARARELFNR